MYTNFHQAIIKLSYYLLYYSTSRSLVCCGLWIIKVESIIYQCNELCHFYQIIHLISKQTYWVGPYSFFQPKWRWCFVLSNFNVKLKECCLVFCFSLLVNTTFEKYFCSGFHWPTSQLFLSWDVGSAQDTSTTQMSQLKKNCKHICHLNSCS